MTETTEGFADETPENMGDILASWKKDGSAISFERVGGGEGPGWSGNTYEGLQVQMGGPFTFSGQNLQETLDKAMSVLGGSRYRWRARSSDGKWHTSEITFPGAPKPLPGVSDPAAERQAAYAQAGQGLGGPAFGAFSGGGSYQAPVDRLTPGFNWSAAKQSWFFVDDDGSIVPIPLGPDGRPIRPPALGPSGGAYFSGSGGYSQPTETPEMRALRESVTELKALVLAKQNNGGDGMAAMILQAMKFQNDSMLATAQADRTAAAARAASEQAARDREEAARKELWNEQKALLKNANGAQASTDPFRAAIDKAIAERISSGVLFGEKPKPDPKDDMSPQERIGEKVIDGLTEFIGLGKKWLDKKEASDKKEKKEPPKNGAEAPKNGTAPEQAPDPDAGIPEDLKPWVMMLEVATEAYDNGRDPAVAFDMLYSSAKGAKLDFDTVLLAMQKLSATQLLNLLAVQEEPVKSRAAPIISSFSSGDGKAWFEKLLARCRSVPVTSKEASP